MLSAKKEPYILGKSKSNRGKKKVAGIIAAVILLVIAVILIIGKTVFGWSRKSEPRSDDPVFVETPFEYKVLLDEIDVELLPNGNTNAKWIATPTYDKVLTTVRSIWKPGLCNDPSKSMIQYPYDRICENAQDSKCHLPDGSPIGGGNNSPYTGWCNKDGTTIKEAWSVCCTPGPYCNPTPMFNWVLGICKGKNCGVGRDAWNVAKNHGSDGLINYIAAYQYNAKTSMWECQMDSSFNIDGRHSSYDISKTNGGFTDIKDSWLPGPNPGGAANWGAGFYPSGRTGVGGPAMAFILSVERVFNFTWYVLNQAVLDRGPETQMSDCAACMTHHKYTADQVQGIKDAGNTWECARSGEWDLLESTMFGNITNNDDYRKLYANNIINKGSKGKASSAGMGSSSYSPNQDWGSTHYFQSDEMGDFF